LALKTLQAEDLEGIIQDLSQLGINAGTVPGFFQTMLQTAYSFYKNVLGPNANFVDCGR